MNGNGDVPYAPTASERKPDNFFSSLLLLNMKLSGLVFALALLSVIEQNSVPRFLQKITVVLKIRSTMVTF